MKTTSIEHPVRPVRFLRHLAATVLAASLMAAFTGARAQSSVSEVSVLSALPIAVSVAAPVMVVSAGVALTVVAVEGSTVGTVWVLERASDGARSSVRLGAQAAAGLSMAVGTVGTVVAVIAISTGWVLSAAGTATAFVPNAIGAALLYNERVTR